MNEQMKVGDVVSIQTGGDLSRRSCHAPTAAS
jgi:hypothetical protein